MKTSEQIFDFRQKKIKYVFFPFGVGQFQNKHFKKAKLFFATQGSSLAIFLTSPLIDTNHRKNLRLYSFYAFSFSYLWSVIDGMLYFQPGQSPIQPLISKNYFGLSYIKFF